MQPTPQFDPVATVKSLIRSGKQGALATLMVSSGDPYCSLVNVATAPDGSPLLLISSLAIHTKNILADARVSLMIDERRAGDPLESARIMLLQIVRMNVDESRQEIIALAVDFRRAGCGAINCRDAASRNRNIPENDVVLGHDAGVPKNEIAQHFHGVNRRKSAGSLALEVKVKAELDLTRS